MRLTFLFSLLLFIGCQNPKNSSPVKNHVGTRSDVDTTLYAKTDSVFIINGDSSILKYAKDDFNDIIDNFPELYNPFPADPDISYYKSGVHKKIIKNGEEKNISFGSEVGQDHYYSLYAYFLRKANNSKQFDGRRDTLIKVFHCINGLYGTLINGGTFFGHQYARIDGYAEYAIYEFKDSDDYYNKPYSISRQKGLYLTSLKQYITDEVSNDNYNGLTEKDKADKIKILFKYVADLDNLITDYFYLQRAQKFQYSKY